MNPPLPRPVWGGVHGKVCWLIDYKKHLILSEATPTIHIIIRHKFNQVRVQEFVMGGGGGQKPFIFVF